MVDVRLSNDKSNPILIGIERNVAMKAFDVHLVVGNFKTEQDAMAAADMLRQMVERELGSRRQTDG